MSVGAPHALPRLALAALAAALPACADRGGPAPAGDPPAPHLILVSIDTLRADRLSCYGYGRETTPHLDALAAESVLFEACIAPSSWTLPSHWSLFTGLYPTTHGVTLPTRRPARTTPLLAELLGAEGWRPFALTGGAWLSAEYGFGRGFREFEDAPRDFPALLARAREYVDLHAGGETPFFAFLHTYDVHCPYDPAPPWDAAFRSPGARPIPTEGRCGNPHFNELDLSPAEARFLSDRYDASIRAADEALGAFLADLEGAGVLERSVLVVTSDHGEEFLEHGRIGHEGTLHAEVLRVPLIVRAPGVAPRRVAAPVGLTDVLPTCLELLGVPVPAGLDGRSLVACMEGDPPAGPDAFRYAELDWNARLRAWVGRDEHWIEDLESGELEYYRPDDPLQTRDRSAEVPELAGRRRDQLEAFAAELAERARPFVDAGRTDAVEALERLGYVISPEDG